MYTLYTVLYILYFTKKKFIVHQFQSIYSKTLILPKFSAIRLNLIYIWGKSGQMQVPIYT
jgi:hypothetical protein